MLWKSNLCRRKSITFIRPRRNLGHGVWIRGNT